MLAQQIHSGGRQLVAREGDEVRQSHDRGPIGPPHMAVRFVVLLTRLGKDRNAVPTAPNHPDHAPIM